MQRKLTITIDEDVYEGLYQRIGRRRISQFIESLVRPHVISADLYAAYAEMARDEERESEALEWAEAIVGDVADDAWCELEGPDPVRGLARRVTVLGTY